MIFRFLWNMAKGFGLLIFIVVLATYCGRSKQSETIKIEKAKPSQEIVKPLVSKPEPKPMALPVPAVTKVKYEDKIWFVTVNNEAVKLVKYNDGEIHLQIGYQYWNDGKWYNKDSVKFQPEWTPPLNESRIVAGIWKNKYISSMEVKAAGKKMDIAYGKIKKELEVKVEKIEIDLKDARKLVTELEKLKKLQEENEALKREIKKELR